MRVLMADGDEVLLEVAQRYLSDHGHEVSIATNGLESVAILCRCVPISWCSIESCSGAAAMVFGLSCCKFPGGRRSPWF